MRNKRTAQIVALLSFCSALPVELAHLEQSENASLVTF